MDARYPATGNAGRNTMRFKRLLTVALMALFGAGTATAASQLNSVQVTPKENAATISLRTTGSFAHKEYRPDDHLVLIDLNGVTPDAAVKRAATLNSAVLKGYKLSSYTSASGSEVTRIELVVGDGVSLEVTDNSDGLQVLLSNSGIKAASAPAPAPSSAASPLPIASPSKSSVPTPAPVQSAQSSKPAPSNAQPVAKTSPPQAPAPVAAKQPAPAATAASHPGTPIVIRSVSVQRGHGTLDVVIEGPNAAQPFLLKNPDRLVVDFGNSVVRPSVKNIEVNTRDVLHVRVGRFQAEPPVTRVVIDLGGPRTFEVVSASNQVIVRIKTEEAAIQPIPAKPAASTPASVPAPVAAKSSPVAPALPPPQTAQASASTVVRPQAAFAPTTVAAKPTVTAAVPPPQTVQVSASVPAKPQVVVATAPAVVKPAVTAPVPPPQTVQVSADAPAKPQTAVAAAPVAVKPPVTSPVPTPVQTVQATASFPAKSQATDVPAPVVEVAQPSPAASALPQVQGVHESLASVSTKTQPQDASLTVPSDSSRNHDQQRSDPGVRAGIAAGTMATSPRESRAVESARLSPPDLLQGTSVQAAPSANRYTGEPISVNLKDVDLKDFFRLIHEISGLNIILDPSVHGNVTLVLDDVPWDQALDIVLKNNALDRELQGNVLRIAATDTLRKEAVDRRAQSEAVALAVDRQTITRFLSYAKAKDVVPTIKKFLTARGDVISDERTNALIISDIPSVLPNLDRMISQLDRKSQEVEIEVRVVSASRTFSRDLGVQLGFNWGNGVSTIGGSNPNGSTSSSTSTGSGTGTTTGTTTGLIPLFTSFVAPGATTGLSLSNITKTYGIDAVLTAAESHNLAKVLSRPRVVTQSNVKAEVKQGVKLPVLTAATSNANASVSYIDSVLRLSVTPQITAENTIFLTVDVENTQPSGLLNTNYILTTQQASTQVLVTDGGTVVIGGVIQTTNTVSSSQTPLLGDIPWLGNLFKQRSVKTETDELIFFITPKIIQT